MALEQEDEQHVAAILRPSDSFLFQVIAHRLLGRVDFLAEFVV